MAALKNGALLRIVKALENRQPIFKAGKTRQSINGLCFGYAVHRRPFCGPSGAPVAADFKRIF